MLVSKQEQERCLFWCKSDKTPYCIVGSNLWLTTHSEQYFTLLRAIIRAWTAQITSHTALHETSAYWIMLLCNAGQLLYYSVKLSHFLHSLKNDTRRAISPEMCKINQSSVDFHSKHTSQFWLDWFIGFVPPHLFLRQRAKMTQHDRIIQ